MKAPTIRIPTRITGDPIHAFWAGEARARRTVFMSMARSAQHKESRGGWVSMARREHRNYCKHMRDIS